MVNISVSRTIRDTAI